MASTLDQTLPVFAPLTAHTVTNNSHLGIGNQSFWKKFEWPESHYNIERPSGFFKFESNFPYRSVKQWVVENRHWSIYLGIAYVLVLFAGRKLMANKQPYSLRKALAAWNVFMAVFSIAITVRVMPYFIRRLFTLPLYGQVCLSDFENEKASMYDETLRCWMTLFVVTKPIEFIDTLFIVLRKQHLHFLHWYHHITVVIMCWYTYGVPSAPSPANAIFYVAMNGFVHSVMYTYYCLRSARIRVPRPLQMSITAMQICQMIVGFFINISALVFLSQGRPCDTGYESIFLALAIYGSYLFLFSQFFYNFYLAPKPKSVKSE